MGRGKVITIRHRGAVCKIEDRLPSVESRFLSGECSYEIQGFEYALKAAIEANAPWAHKFDGRKKLYHMGHRTFQAGLLPRVKRTLEKQFGYTVIIEKDEKHCNTVTFPELQGDYESRPYQDDALTAAVTAGRGVLRVATGGGKTVIAGRLIHRYSVPALFLVHTKDLLYQAIDVFRGMFGEEMVGQVGDGVIAPSIITVATIQTVARAMGVEFTPSPTAEDGELWKDEETEFESGVLNAEILNRFGIVFMDECHRVAAPTAMDVMERLTEPQFRFGLSGSPWRDDGADLAIEAALGPIIYAINASELYRQGYLVMPIIRMLEPKAMQFGRATKYQAVYDQYIARNEQRNLMGVNAALSMMRRGRPTLILVRLIKHGLLLQQMISQELDAWVPFLSGSDSAQVRKRALDDMRSGRSGILIASTIADEGLDIRPLSGLVLMGGGKSSVKALQRVGRTLRTWEGKDYAEIVDFDDRAKFLSDHSVARRKLYETEDEWIVTDV